VNPLPDRGISRRQLFRGELRGGRPVLRPPWAPGEDVFLAGCDRCGDCVRACPEKVIRVGGGGFPEVSFDLGGCTFCAECVSACRGKALLGDPKADRAWALSAEIGGACLVNGGVVCRSCGEACDKEAIRFRLRVGGAAQPVLDERRCTGCGSCVSVCPVRAVKLVAARSEPLAAAG
jgi:ferredoxin-type protein NapF